MSDGSEGARPTVTWGDLQRLAAEIGPVTADDAQRFDCTLGGGNNTPPRRGQVYAPEDGAVDLDVSCPRCGRDTVDRRGGDVRSVLNAEDRDDYEVDNPLGTRGGFVAIGYSCYGCGLNYNLVIANHKGTERAALIAVDLHADE